MNLELIISGLWVIVLKSKQARPEQPDAVELLLVDAHHHRPRLSYWPLDVKATVEPDLCVDPGGRHVAALGLRDKVVALRLTKNPKKNFTVTWGPEKAKAPPDPDSEAWMNWVPAAGDLGMNGVRLGKPDGLQKGASARLILPPGELKARRVVRDAQTPHDYLQWEFPARKGLQRALANEVVFRADGFDSAFLDWTGEEKVLSSQLMDKTLEMGISNDLETVPVTYLVGSQSLDHSKHFEELAEPFSSVQVPQIVEKAQRTGWPICHGVYYVEKS